MIFKYEFMQSDWVPVEHLEMDKNRRMRAGAEELVRTVLENFPYKARVGDRGDVIYGIEVAILSRIKYERAIRSIDRLLVYHPMLQHAVEDVLREMDEPEKNTENS